MKNIIFFKTHDINGSKMLSTGGKNVNNWQENMGNFVIHTECFRTPYQYFKSLFLFQNQM